MTGPRKSTKTTTFTPLDVVQACLPLYQGDMNPERLAGAAAEALSRLLGSPLLLELPGSLGSHRAGGEADGRGWEIEFSCEGGIGRAVGGGAAPDADVIQALRLELTRLCDHLALWRSISRRLDRLEFRLQALHQIARTLSIVRDVPDTEANIVDFTGELFFTWWVALYRPRDHRTLEPRRIRSLSGPLELPSLPAAELAERIPVAAQSAGFSLDDHPTWLPGQTRIVAPLDIGSERLGCLLLGPRFNEEPYANEDLQLLGTVAQASAIALRNAELLARVHQQTLLDELTGLYNRRFFDARLREEVERAGRYGRPLGLVFLDLDHFKRYNDSFGHAAGDLLLARVGSLIRADVRKSDMACRYGGEEFGVIVPEASLEDTRRFGERLRMAVSGIDMTGGIQQQISVSVGAASFPDCAGDARTLLEAADRALYRAKASGRNRVSIAEPRRDPGEGQRRAP